MTDEKIMHQADAEKQTDHDLPEIQVRILDILKEVLPILEDMHLSCIMQGGTMLGSIRHGGFIPWDDDVDFGLTRREYEYFLAHIEERLPSHLALRTYEDETDHHYYFARIVDTRYRIRRTGSKEERYENLWLDFFPLDGMPDSFFIRQIHKLRLSFCRLFYHLSCIEKVNADRPGRPWIEKAVIKTALLFSRGGGKAYIRYLRKIDALLKKYPPEGSEWIINFTGQTSFRFTEMLPKSIYGDLKKYPFESFMLYGPEDADAYLKALYGDYMTPPREGERNAHVSTGLEYIEENVK